MAPPSSSLPPIGSLPSLPTSTRADVLDALFEPSTPLHTLSLDLLHTQTFPSYNDLIASVGVQLTDLAESTSSSDTQWLHKILGSHPRLGAAKVDSAQSSAEQAQLHGGGQEEATRLRELNEAYEREFPGLRYVYVASQRLTDVVAPFSSSHQLTTVFTKQCLCQWQKQRRHHGEYAR